MNQNPNPKTLEHLFYAALSYHCEGDHCTYHDYLVEDEGLNTQEAQEFLTKNHNAIQWIHDNLFALFKEIVPKYYSQLLPLIQKDI